MLFDLKPSFDGTGWHYILPGAGKQEEIPDEIQFQKTAVKGTAEERLEARLNDD